MKKLLAVLVSVFACVGVAMAAVNINTASEKELETLPGIGPAKAKAIVEYRKKNGEFKSADDLKKVDGIGDKTVADLKGQVSLSGATKVDAKADAKSDAKTEKKDTKPAAKEEKKDPAKK